MMDSPKLSRSEIVKKAWLKRRVTFVPPMKGKLMSEASRQKMRRGSACAPEHKAAHA